MAANPCFLSLLSDGAASYWTVTTDYFPCLLASPAKDIRFYHSNFIAWRSGVKVGFKLLAEDLESAMDRLVRTICYTAFVLSVIQNHP